MDGDAVHHPCDTLTSPPTRPGPAGSTDLHPTGKIWPPWPRRFWEALGRPREAGSVSRSVSLCSLHGFMAVPTDAASGPEPGGGSPTPAELARVGSSPDAPTAFWAAPPLVGQESASPPPALPRC